MSARHQVIRSVEFTPIYPTGEGSLEFDAHVSLSGHELVAVLRTAAAVAAGEGMHHTAARLEHDDRVVSSLMSADGIYVSLGLVVQS